MTLETLLERADHALYQAKAAGRNRVGREADSGLAECLTPSAVRAAPNSLPRPQEANRRHYLRRAVARGVQIHVLGSSLAVSESCSYGAVARNISEHGMQIVAERPYPVQAPVVLAMEDGEHGWDHATVHVGTVAWTTTLPDERGCMLGITFDDGGASPVPV